MAKEVVKNDELFRREFEELVKKYPTVTLTIGHQIIFSEIPHAGKTDAPGSEPVAN